MYIANTLMHSSAQHCFLANWQKILSVIHFIVCDIHAVSANQKLIILSVISGDNTVMYILIAAVVGASILGGVVAYVCVRQRTRFPKQPSPKAKTVELNALLPKQQQLRAREFPLANVRFMQELGEGAFGKNIL